jgi:Holliday junction resolvase RusA-like endonuclease
MTNASKLKMHWTVRKKELDQWKSAIAAILRTRTLPPKPLKLAKLTLTRCSSSEPDFDGLVSGFKGIIDSLVRAGVLENDKPSNIGTSVYLWEQASPGKGKIKVAVEEIC